MQRQLEFWPNETEDHKRVCESTASRSLTVDKNQPSTEPYSLKRLDRHLDQLQTGNVTLVQHKEELSHLIHTRDQMIANLVASHTLKELKQLAIHWGHGFVKLNSKQACARQIYVAAIRRFAIDGQVQHGSWQESVETAVLNQLNAIDEEVWSKRAAQKSAMSELRQASTVKEFRRVIATCGVQDLSMKQKAEFERLQLNDAVTPINESKWPLTRFDNGVISRIQRISNRTRRPFTQLLREACLMYAEIMEQVIDERTA